MYNNASLILGCPMFIKKIRQIWKNTQKNFTSFVQKRPFISFFGLLLTLFIVIAVGHQLRKPAAVTQITEPAAKDVELFSTGATPHIKLQAKIEKSGVITIVAQSAGIIQKIRIQEGAHLKRGTQLFSLSTNYQGGNAPDLARQIAQKNYQFLVDNYDTQKSAIDKQREVALATEAQAAQLRDITRQSLTDTSSLIDLNQGILDTLNKELKDMVAAGATNDDTVGLREEIMPFMSSLNSARAALRSNQYQSDESKQPAELSTVNRDLALTQLDLQQRTLDLNKDVSKLNLQVSQVNESLMFPVSPFAGTVERIFVKAGQNVTPGTPLAEIRGDVNTASAIVLTSADVAKNISRLEPSQLDIGEQTISVLPRSISTEPTDGNLLSVIYTLPDEFAVNVTNNSYVPIDVPVGVPAAVISVHPNDPFVPLDAVYQTQNNAYVLVAEPQDNTLVARSHQVKLGQVFGKYVDVLEGVKTTDQIILNRNVIEGDIVQIKSAK